MCDPVRNFIQDPQFSGTLTDTSALFMLQSQGRQETTGKSCQALSLHSGLLAVVTEVCPHFTQSPGNTSK
jgi:hypothetical protein